MLTGQVRLGVTVLRLAVASVFLIHGSYRLLAGTVDGFGSFLASSGVPLGVAFAWLLTVVELVGGLLLAGGYGVRPLCAWFGAELISGIVMVHGKEGWFVVGGGRNGMEYSVLIVLCLLSVALSHEAPYRLGSRGR